jgi:DNA polymerase I
MGQSELGDYGGTETDDRPVTDEAQAVAGDTSDDAAYVDTSDALFPEAEETVELAVIQVDYTIEGTGDDEHPIVNVFGRTDTDDLVHVRVHGFKPYFYAPAQNVTKGRLMEYDRITGWEETDENDEPYTSIRGEELVKIYGQTPRDVGQIRDDFDHYEADILFPNRLLIDKDITSGIRVPKRELDDDTDRQTLRVHHEEIAPIELDATPRVNTFDIEVDDRSGFPEDGEEPIICIASHDSYDDEYILWLYEAPDGETAPDELADYQPIQTDRREDESDVELHYDIRRYDEEAEMLDAFLTYIEDTDPDVLTGWNFDDFDAPYLIDRLEVLEGRTDRTLDYNRLSRVAEVWTSNWGGPDIKGRIVFDLLYAYQRTKFTELDSYRLDDVGERELGVGKERYPGDIGDLWEDDPERLLEYNLRDVELCVELDREQDIIAFWNEVRQFVGCKLEDATTPGDAVDMYVLHNLHDKFALPSKGQQESEDYEGGAVFDPITGVRENVSVLDLKSLYPMCMVTVNASPETKVDPEEYDGETYRAPNGTRFRKEPDGAIREMVDELLTEREEKKSQRDSYEAKTPEYEQYDRQQQAVKVIMNCFTPDTEVLTPEGVRNIQELERGDDVYSLNPETMEMKVKAVTETHAYPDYRDKLVDIQTSKIDFRVTPNHRMLVRKNGTNGITEDEYDFVEAGELYDYCHYEMPHDWEFDHGDALETVDLTQWLDDDYEVWVRPSVHGHTFTAELGWEPPTVLKNDIGVEGYVFSAAEFEEHRAYIESVCEQSFVHSEANRKWIPRTYDGDDFVELLAWYVTEGNVYTTEPKQFGDNYRGSSTTVKIAQETTAVPDGGESEHSQIGALLDRMGFDYYVNERAYQFTSKLFGEFLREYCGDGSFEKQIPAFVFETSKEQKQQFLQTLIDGDGDRQRNSWRFTTASDRLRDDVLRLCAHLGLTANYNRDSDIWRIYCTEDAKNSFRMHRSGSQSTAEDGVYCVTVEDNHTLMAGRNGTFQHVGQSLYGVLGWDRFRLYDREMGAAVTATGREVIDFTEDVTSELDKEVIYGDTDSVMVSVGNDVSKEEAIERSFEIEEKINEAYDEFAIEELNAAEHRFQIEFEKLYRRFFQAGTKKRYAGHIVWKEGQDVDDIDITGFEYQRSDIAPITKEVQRKVIDMIVTGEDREDVKYYVHDVIEEFQKGDADPEEIGVPGGIGKRLDNYDTENAHVRGAKYANRVLGTNFQRGSKPKHIYLDRVHADFFERIEAEHTELTDDPVYQEFKRDPDVICFEFGDQIPEEFEIDWEKMLDKTLEGPIARILEALDISWDEVKSGQEQTGLGQYM